MARRKFTLLRMYLDNNDINNEYLAELLGWSTDYIIRRINGHRPWALDDVYNILDVLRISHDQVSTFFPAAEMETYAGSKKEPSSKTARRGKTA